MSKKIKIPDGLGRYIEVGDIICRNDSRTGPMEFGVVSKVCPKTIKYLCVDFEKFSIEKYEEQAPGKSVLVVNEVIAEYKRVLASLVSNANRVDATSNKPHILMETPLPILIGRKIK